MKHLYPCAREVHWLREKKLSVQFYYIHMCVLVYEKERAFNLSHSLTFSLSPSHSLPFFQCISNSLGVSFFISGKYLMLVGREGKKVYLCWLFKKIYKIKRRKKFFIPKKNSWKVKSKFFFKRQNFRLFFFHTNYKKKLLRYFLSDDSAVGVKT